MLLAVQDYFSEGQSFEGTLWWVACHHCLQSVKLLLSIDKVSN